MDILRLLIGSNILLVLLILIIHLNKPDEHRRSFHILLTGFFLFSLFHFTYVLISKIYFPADGWVENSAPFGLMYGPFLHFGITTYKRQKLKVWTIIQHCMPYLIFLVIHIVILATRLDPDSRIAEVYMRILYFSVPVSAISYGAWGWYFVRKHRQDTNAFFYLFVLVLAFIYFTVAYYFMNVQVRSSSLVQADTNDMSGLIIYTFALAVLVSLGIYILQRKPILKFTPKGFTSDIEASYPDTLKSENSVNHSYDRSGLSKTDLDRLEKLLDNTMEEKNMYLDHNLNLNKLATELKIPDHHLTQLLSVRKRENFNEFINKKRVTHACELLKSIPGKTSYGDIGFSSGFNSKSTFYRRFKQIKKMTPAQYHSSVM